jgi:hypothetical protein
MPPIPACRFLPVEVTMQTTERIAFVVARGDGFYHVEYSDKPQSDSQPVLYAFRSSAEDWARQMGYAVFNR